MIKVDISFQELEDLLNGIPLKCKDERCDKWATDLLHWNDHVAPFCRWHYEIRRGLHIGD